jgi:hypothetical protein
LLAVLLVPHYHEMKVWLTGFHLASLAAFWLVARLMAVETRKHKHKLLTQ